MTITAQEIRSRLLDTRSFFKVFLQGTHKRAKNRSSSRQNAIAPGKGHSRHCRTKSRPHRRYSKTVRHHGYNVLLAEDNELNREIAEELLKTQGLSVSCAENGQIAVDMFKSSPSPPGTYNIILMDIQIPMMDGYQTAAIRSAPDHPDAATIPIIAMTTNTFSEDVATAAAAGMR